MHQRNSLLIRHVVNFERLDDAVRARKALNGRDVLGSDVGAIRIGFAKVPVKNGQEGTGQDESVAPNVQGVGDLSVGATIHALRNVKGASTIPVDQQVLSGAVLLWSDLSVMTATGHDRMCDAAFCSSTGSSKELCKVQR